MAHPTKTWQAAEVLNATFATHAGYNRWAESNSLVVLYPQVAIDGSHQPLMLGQWLGLIG